MTVEPGKNFLGQVGFPTPNTAIETSACRTFRVPDSDDWLGLLMGAVEELRKEYNYYNWGDLTPAEAALAWNEIIANAYDDSLLENCVGVPAPYWDQDSADDADDESSPSEQPWYGNVVIIDDRLSFVDNLGIWLIAGFIAYAGLPAAAIAFVAPARNFVLAFQSFSVGGVVKAFIDLVQVGEVDTYSATDGVANMTIYNAPIPGSFRAFSDDPPQLLLVLQDTANPAVIGTPAMRVIRKRLDQDEVYPTAITYDPDCDCVKRDWGGDVGVVDYPQGDPRHAVSFLRPARVSDVRCASAANMVAWIHNFIDQVISALTAGSGVLFIVSLLFDDLALISQGFSLFLAEGTELVSDLAGAGAVLINASFDSDTYALLLCIFDCRMDATGNVSAASLSFIETDINAQLNTTAALFVNAILGIQGEVGLTNAGRIGSATADCSGCECNWCHTDDYTLSDGGATASLGAWVDGLGWEAGMLDGGGGNAYTFIDLQTNIPAGSHTITEVRWFFDIVEGTFDSPIMDRQWSPTGATPNWYTTSAAGSTTSPWIYDPNLVDAEILGVTISSGYLAHTVAKSGNVIITRRTVYGTGDNPYAENNC